MWNAASGFGCYRRRSFCRFWYMREPWVAIRYLGSRVPSTHYFDDSVSFGLFLVSPPAYSSVDAAIGFCVAALRAGLSFCEEEKRNRVAFSLLLFTISTSFPPRRGGNRLMINNSRRRTLHWYRIFQCSTKWGEAISIRNVFFN